jgi:hypothetical protein
MDIRDEHAQPAAADLPMFILDVMRHDDAENVVSTCSTTSRQSAGGIVDPEISQRKTSLGGCVSYWRRCSFGRLSTTLHREPCETHKSPRRSNQRKKHGFESPSSAGQDYDNGSHQCGGDEFACAPYLRRHTVSSVIHPVFRASTFSFLLSSIRRTF